MSGAAGAALGGPAGFVLGVDMGVIGLLCCTFTLHKLMIKDGFTFGRFTISRHLHLNFRNLGTFYLDFFVIS